MNQRKEFIRYFFTAINTFDYVLLKYLHASSDDIPETSDIDLLIRKSELSGILDLIRKGPKPERINLHRKSFVTFVSLVFADGSYLELDLIHRFERKGIIYLNAAEVLKSSERNAEGMKVPSLHHTFEYIILFSLINKSSVPQKYQQYLAALSFEERAGIFGYICSKYKLHLNTLDELYDPSLRETKKITTRILQFPINKGFYKFFHRIRYLGDLSSDFIGARGITVTFSGVDGAGKSTILENVKVTLQKKYRQKTIVLRHRPSLLPILSAFRYGKKNAEQKATQNLPRQGNNSSQLGSLFRFLYYYTDYLVGQFYVHFRYTLRGYNVLYDRYYFDFIIDSKRSNIILPKRFLKACYYFVFKPNVNVFLYAPAEIILSRKQEMSEGDINQLTAQYKELFEDLGKNNKHHHYLVINNTDLNKTLDLVIKECISAAI
ncbi:hypothetical protein BH11BAC2_BH11BAC2_08970 [soil metagenome]